MTTYSQGFVCCRCWLPLLPVAAAAAQLEKSRGLNLRMPRTPPTHPVCNLACGAAAHSAAQDMWSCEINNDSTSNKRITQSLRESLLPLQCLIWRQSPAAHEKIAYFQKGRSGSQHGVADLRPQELSPSRPILFHQFSGPYGHLLPPI